MRKETIICITCPLGCPITVTGESEDISKVEGFGCKRGKTYAVSEFSHPERILTTTVKILGGDVSLMPVRSSKPIPKELLMRCMAEIKKVCIAAPIHRYDVIIPNILATGSDIVATGESL